MADYKQQYQLWLEKAVDESVRESLLKMQDNDENMQDAFYKDIEFGTAGMRGIMEAGTNRINVYTLFRATTGVALYMKRYNMTSCAITYDSRNNSRMFSQVVSATLASHGIKVYFTRECMPTPYLSFMVRNYHTDMGINITASHNASPYNGYKVYDSEGCQLTDDAANELTAVIEGVDPFQSPIPRFADYENGLIVYSDEEMEERYKQSVIAQGLNSAEGIKAVYSPLNGARIQGGAGSSETCRLGLFDGGAGTGISRRQLPHMSLSQPRKERGTDFGSQSGKQSCCRRRFCQRPGLRQIGRCSVRRRKVRHSDG